MTENTPVKSDEVPAAKFKGYTLEELKYQRALTALRREFCKSKITSKVYSLRKHNPLSRDGEAGNNVTGKLSYFLPKVISGMNYLDYALLGWSAFSSARKVFSFFRRKKKK